MAIEILIITKSVVKGKIKEKSKKAPSIEQDADLEAEISKIKSKKPYKIIITDLDKSTVTTHKLIRKTYHATTSNTTI